MKNQFDNNHSEISLIVAYSKNRVIGKNGKIPWNLKSDQQRFKKLTVGNIVVMGRNTFLEIYNKLNGPLPKRVNIVISKTKDFNSIGCLTFKSLEEAIKYSTETYPQKKVFIAGGSSLYKEAIPIVDKMYITEIDIKIDGDCFFPLLNDKEFDIIEDKVVSEELTYRNVTYLRRR